MAQKPFSNPPKSFQFLPKPSPKSEAKPNPLTNLKLTGSALGVLVIVAIVLAIWMNSQAQQAQAKTSSLQQELDRSIAKLVILEGEKNKTENTLLETSLERSELQKRFETLKTENRNQISELQSSELQNIRRIKRILEPEPVNNSLLKVVRDQYAQWDFYACSYYLGADLLTTGGNVTVPLQCVIATGQYMKYSKQLTDSLAGVEDRSSEAFAEILKLYPQLNSS